MLFNRNRTTLVIFHLHSTFSCSSPSQVRHDYDRLNQFSLNHYSILIQKEPVFPFRMTSSTSAHPSPNDSNPPSLILPKKMLRNSNPLITIMVFDQKTIASFGGQKKNNTQSSINRKYDDVMWWWWDDENQPFNFITGANKPPSWPQYYPQLFA